MQSVPHRQTHRKESYVTVVHHSDGWHWQTITPITVRTSRETFPDSLTAARAGATVACAKNLELRLGCNVLRDALIALFQIEGISLAREGHPADCCWNIYQQQGYRAATQLIAASFGWCNVPELPAEEKLSNEPGYAESLTPYLF